MREITLADIVEFVNARQRATEWLRACLGSAGEECGRHVATLVGWIEDHVAELRDARGTDM
jgi:hypothetical protein